MMYIKRESSRIDDGQPKAGVFRSEPFLKWAGGKRWLAYNYLRLFPKDFELYLEPFLGSAAIYFALKPASAILSDANKELINLYQVLAANPIDLERELIFHHKNHEKDYYYKIRSMDFSGNIAKAAQFLYLNRSCWNGLYRVNTKGKFNVPIGTKTNIVLPNDNFIDTAKLLSTAELLYCDFEQTVDCASKGDFLFVDPPYTVRHDNNGFVKYNENIFSWEDQCRLKTSLERAADRGSMIMVTNANHISIRELYKDFGSILEVGRASVISGISSGRVQATELVIRNYR